MFLEKLRPFGHLKFIQKYVPDTILVLNSVSNMYHMGIGKS